MLSRLKRLMGTHVQVLRARFIHWTKPLTTSLPLGTIADLGRTKSELVAENALLRQQLLILKRQVKRPACTQADRVLLVFLARMVRAWKQALFLVQEDDPAALASRSISFVLETQVKGPCYTAEDISRNHCLDQGDGSEESTVGR